VLVKKGELSHHQALFLKNINCIFITANRYEMHYKLLKGISRSRLKTKNKIFVSFVGSQGSNGVAGRLEGVNGVSAPGVRVQQAGKSMF
jgi:hypothetical protein